MINNFSFRCPYCDNTSTITSPDRDLKWIKLDLNELDIADNVALEIWAVSCPNPECKKLILSSELFMAEYSYGEWKKIKSTGLKWQMLPDSYAKLLPEYIPKAISVNYYEACKIRDLSPKASATLSRRCLQGMIRDFYGIKKNQLKKEIDSLEGVVDDETWGAIDAVRKMGNIGAHMEKDINLIIDIEPNEAQLLIELIETLIEEWYVNRYERTERLKKIKEMSDNKRQKKKAK